MLIVCSSVRTTEFVLSKFLTNVYFCPIFKKIFENQFIFVLQNHFSTSILRLQGLFFYLLKILKTSQPSNFLLWVLVEKVCASSWYHLFAFAHYISNSYCVKACTRKLQGPKSLERILFLPTSHQYLAWASRSYRTLLCVVDPSRVTQPKNSFT